MIVDIQNAIATLTAEQADLQSAVADLQAQHTELNSQLDILLADAERNSKPTAQKAATEAESALQGLDTQLRRKRAALAACERDLSQAQADLIDAQRAAVLDELVTIHNEYEQAAFALDNDIADLNAWQRLAELAAQGNRLYTQVGKGSRSGIFVPPHDVRGKLLAALGSQIDWACGRRGESPKDLTPVIAFDVDRIRVAINHL